MLSTNPGGGNAGGGHGFGGGDFHDIFGDFFNDVMGGRGRRSQGGPARGSDLKYDISITLEEAFKGLDKKISFSAMVVAMDAIVQVVLTVEKQAAVHIAKDKALLECNKVFLY
jgi:DnaJ-class molecular chaperone